MEDVDGGPRVETVGEADQADVEAAELERLRKEAEKLYEARSSVLKRKDLPRPAKVDPAVFLPVGGNGDDGNVEEARRLIQKELVTLLQHDAHSHPVLPQNDNHLSDADGRKKKKKRKHGKAEAEEAVVLMEEVPPEVPLDYIPEDAIKVAKQAIEAELEVSLNSNVAAVMDGGKVPDRDSAVAVLSDGCREASTAGAHGMVYVKGKGWADASAKSDDADAETLSSLRLEFETLKAATEALRRKNDKQEAKLGVVNGGYAKRSDKCGEETLRSYADLQNAVIEQSVYRMLQSQEQRGGADRIERLKREVASLRDDEAALQKEYGELVVEKRRLVVKAKSQFSTRES